MLIKNFSYFQITVTKLAPKWKTKQNNILENNAEQVSGQKRPFYGECKKQKLDLTREPKLTKYFFGQ